MHTQQRTHTCTHMHTHTCTHMHTHTHAHTHAHTCTHTHAIITRPLYSCVHNTDCVHTCLCVCVSVCTVCVLYSSGFGQCSSWNNVHHCLLMAMISQEGSLRSVHWISLWMQKITDCQSLALMQVHVYSGTLPKRVQCQVYSLKEGLKGSALFKNSRERTFLVKVHKRCERNSVGHSPH